MVLVGEWSEDRHGVLRGLTLRAHVFIDVVGLALQDSHTATVVPVLTPITADVEPVKITNKLTFYLKKTSKVLCRKE